MKFKMPQYQAPDFFSEAFQNCQDAVAVPVAKKSVAPPNYHATTIFPEYFRVGGQWKLLQQTRMDVVVVLGNRGSWKSRSSGV